MKLTKKIIVTDDEQKIVGVYNVPCDHNVKHELSEAAKRRQKAYNEWNRGQCKKYPSTDIADYLPECWKPTKDIKIYPTRRLNVYDNSDL